MVCRQPLGDVDTVCTSRSYMLETLTVIFHPCAHILGQTARPFTSVEGCCLCLSQVSQGCCLCLSQVSQGCCHCLSPGESGLLSLPVPRWVRAAVSVANWVLMFVDLCWLRLSSLSLADVVLWFCSVLSSQCTIHCRVVSEYSHCCVVKCDVCTTANALLYTLS